MNEKELDQKKVQAYDLFMQIKFVEKQLQALNNQFIELSNEVQNAKGTDK